MLIDGGGDENVETSSLEASNLIVLRVSTWTLLIKPCSWCHASITYLIFLWQQSSIIHSNANLGVHGQGLLNLTGPGDCIEAQQLVLSLFYSINVRSSLNIFFNFYLCLWTWKAKTLDGSIGLTSEHECPVRCCLNRNYKKLSSMLFEPITLPVYVIITWLGLLPSLL